MPHSDGSARAEASPGCLPPPSTSPQGLPAPTPRSPPPTSKVLLARNPPEPPRLPPMLLPQPGTRPRTPPQPPVRPSDQGDPHPHPASPEAAGGGRTGRPARPHPHAAGDGASRRPPGRDKGCSAAGRTVPGSPRPAAPVAPEAAPLASVPPARLHSPDCFREEEAASLGPCKPYLFLRPQGPQPLLRVSRAVEVASSLELKRLKRRGAFAKDPSSSPLSPDSVARRLPAEPAGPSPEPGWAAEGGGR